MIRKILIVDDEKDLLEEFSFLLKEHGYETCVALNAGEFENIFFSEKPDLIIMDIMLPDEMGPDLYNRVMQISALKPPVIFASGLVEMQNEVRIVRGRQVALYPKPIDIDKLVGDIRAAFPPSLAA